MGWPKLNTVRSVVGVPLLIDERALGALFIDSHSRPGAFAPDDVRLLQSLASQVAVAIENARLFEQVRAGGEQLRELAGYLQTAREDERTAIAREIHDELGQALTALKIDLAWLAKRLFDEQDELKDKATGMSQLIDDTIQIVRRMSTEMRPGLLDDLGLAAAVEWQAQEFSERMGMACELHLDEDDLLLDRDPATALFRILQEALTNVARHAQASQVRVDLEGRADEVVLVVQDNGVGITPEQIADRHSLGLIGMRERARFWGGQVTFEGAAGRGTAVTARMPQTRAPEGCQ
jgi:signal transduction histidine kinase